MNAETALLDTDLDRLARREMKAHKYLHDAVESWINFIDEINAIHNEGDWKANYPSWKAYLEVVFLPKLSYGYERLYQLQAAQPFASMIEKHTGVVLKERQVRYIRSELGYESALDAIELVDRTSKITNELGLPIEPKYLQAVQDVLIERDVTDGNTSLDGETVPTNPKLIDITHIAAIQAVLEANKRGKQQIRDHSQKRALTVTPELMLFNGKKYAVFPSHVPLEMVIGKQITFYVEEKAAA